MEFPSGVRTRTITLSAPYPPVDIGPNQKFDTRVKVTTSRALIWNGVPITQMVDTSVKNVDNGEVSFVVMVTDMVGMLDAKTMQLIDISGDRHTHLLTAKIKYYHMARLVWETNRVFPVPTGDGPLDLDGLINPDPLLGILVPVPTISDQQVADAVEGYLEQNELATPTFVEGVITQHVNSNNPHPVYDDMPDLTLIFENGLV